MMRPEFDPQFEFATDEQLADLHGLTVMALQQRLPLKEYESSVLKGIAEDGLPIIAGSPPYYELKVPNANIRQVVPDAFNFLQLSAASGANFQLEHVGSFYEWAEEPEYCAAVCSFVLTKDPSSGEVESILFVMKDKEGWQSDRDTTADYAALPFPLTETDLDRRLQRMLHTYELEKASGFNRLMMDEYLALRTIVDRLGDILLLAAA